MKAEIISVGTELLLGEITDTNAVYLAGQLPPLGIDLYWISTVGDNPGRLVEVLGRAWGRSQLIVVTGGLGPTEDDITREAIARMLGEELTADPALERELRHLFVSWGMAMPQSNLRQATLVPSAQALPNHRGTAPGWWLEREGRILVALPGPPLEMQPMWQAEVLPRLSRRLGGEVILSRTLKTFGLAEATVGELLTPFLSSPNPTIGIYVKPEGIQVRLTAKATNPEKAGELISSLESQISPLLGGHLWGWDEDTLEGLVGSLLQARKLTLATMESCTGGLLSSTITDVPGSSTYFKGGLVAYSNEAKIAYGVAASLIDRHGAVSPQAAGAMALAACQKLGADVGIGVTGVAGPDPLEGKPVGTVHIGIAVQQRTATFSILYPFARPQIKRLATSAALFHLRKLLLAWG